MSSAVLIAYIERRNELRARQIRIAGDEFRWAMKIQEAIQEQSRLEDRIMEWDVAIDKLKAEEAVKINEGSWLLKKLGL